MSRKKGLGKEIVENCLILNSSQLYKNAKNISFDFDGVLTFINSRTNRELGSIGYFLVELQGEKLLVVTYVKKAQNESLKITDYIKFTVTKPCFGGERQWFLCPRCKQRRGKLYLPPGDLYFRCRLCHSLTYRSCQESRRWDFLYKKIGKQWGLSFDEVKARLENI